MTRKSTLFAAMAVATAGLHAPQLAAQKADVWDFGATQLDASLYNNHLTEELINGLYTGVEAGTTGKSFVSTFTADILTWTGGTNDRLRTTNTALIRYDNNCSGSVDGQTFAGLLYINASAATGRYFTLTLAEDDEVTVYAKSQNGNGTFHFEGGNSQSDVLNAGTSATKLSFTAQTAGSYKIYESADKPSYYRIVRTPATYTEVSGTVTSSGSALPVGASLCFTNEAGKAWLAPIANGAYSVSLPKGHTYALSLSDASQFVITSDKSLTTSGSTQTLSVTVSDIALATLKGNITGLPSAQISKLALQFTPTDAEKVYAPAAEIASDGSYTVDLEQGVSYTLTATGVNDYSLVNPTMSISTATTADIAFSVKPTYAVSITAEGLTAEQQGKLAYAFSNLKEEGYAYSFAAGQDVSLRDGVYSMTVSGLDELPLAQRLTSNLTISGAPTSKTVRFQQVNEWPFDDATITTATTYYRGAKLSGNVSNEKAKGHLVGNNGGTFSIPMNPGEKAVVTFYYKASFSIEGGETVNATTSSGSTSKTESVEYRYTGTEPGFTTIAFSGQSYITHITTKQVVAYASTIHVGKDATYTTINEALEAVRCMERESSQRVEIVIEPGNYEEMLTIDVPNISLVNASATPSLELKNKGVDIDDNAVRITSYYGHGYHYYSMNAQKYDAEVLQVNKENGYRSYNNVGGGTTAGSYWNATVVISADGFEAHNIIFENSFNQYISAKEADDVVEEWTTGGKGTRPTTAGSTAVQGKSFVERAAAVAITNNTDRTLFNNCRIIGRQDSFFGGVNCRMAYYKGCVMGAVDYIFGGMIAAFYQTELQFNTSDDKNDYGYITAAQQTSGRGYLMYECNVTSATPGVDNASSYESKPGYFGRPWAAKTAEVVFYNTKVNATSNPSYTGKSLITAEGWSSSLSGESALCGEVGTTELSGENNTASRASWAATFSDGKLADGTDITLYNFTCGTDGWDPFAELLEKEGTAIGTVSATTSAVKLTVNGSTLRLSNLGSNAQVAVYTTDGTLRAQASCQDAYTVSLPTGIYVVRVATAEGVTAMKAAIR